MGLFGFKFVRQPRANDPALIKRVSDLELELEKLKSHMTSLRGLVNRKLNYPLEEESLKEAGAIDDGLNELRQK